MSTLFTIPYVANTAHALPGLSVLDQSNIWSPYGTFPTFQNLVLVFYSGDAAEYAAFQRGGLTGLDVTDSGTAGGGPPASQWPIYDNTCGTCTSTSPGVDWNLTAVQGSANWQGMYFNGNSSRWAAWGCDWQFYNSACGIEMRQAFAHLINRPDFVIANFAGGGGGAPIHDDVPADKVLSVCFSPTIVPCDGTPPSPLAGCPTSPTIGNDACTFQTPASVFCLWDTVSNAGCTSATGPYLVGGTGLSTGFPTLPAAPIAACPSGNTAPAAWAGCNNDFALAAEHLVLAGVASGMDANYQVGPHLTNPAGISTHPLRACVRPTRPYVTMGTGWANALKLLLGSGGSPNTNAVAVGGCGFAPSSEPPLSPIDDWDMSTYGYQNPNPFPVYLYTQFSTRFSSILGGCGAAANDFNDIPTNPTFTCIDGRGSAGDADVALLKAVSTTNMETTFDHLMTLDPGSALDILGKAVASIPVDTPYVRTPALRTVIGITNTHGLAFNNPIIFNYAHQGPYIPVNPAFRFDQSGPATAITWGQAQPTSFLNPFQASSVSELNVIGLVYDTVFKSNPVVPSQVYCEMCQTIVQGTTFCGTPAITCTTYTVQLRQNLRFQDGAQVTAQDVAFSYLNLRDASAVISGALGLLDHVILDAKNSLALTIVMKGQSIGHLANLAEVPVIPMNGNSLGGFPRWACPSSGISLDGVTPCKPALYDVGAGLPLIPQVDQFKSTVFYDPILDINFIGSGLWMCVALPEGGAVGTGCAEDPQERATGQAIGPGGSLDLSVFNETFAQYTRFNDPAWGTNPSRSGQQQEFLYADKGNNNQVTISDLTSVNLCFLASGPTTTCSAAAYNYWLRSSLHGGTGTISLETAIVAEHYHDGGVLPWSWGAGACPGSGGDLGTVGTLTNVIAYTCH